MLECCHKGTEAQRGENKQTMKHRCNTLGWGRESQRQEIHEGQEVKDLKQDEVSIKIKQEK